MVQIWTLSVKIELKPGDMVYFEPHLALGVLLEKRDNGWVYALRSPPSDNLTSYMVSIDFAAEKDFIEAIEKGRFQYYESR
jgi:hypothetical protein